MNHFLQNVITRPLKWDFTQLSTTEFEMAKWQIWDTSVTGISKHALLSHEVVKLSSFPILWYRNVVCCRKCFKTFCQNTNKRKSTYAISCCDTCARNTQFPQREMSMWLRLSFCLTVYSFSMSYRSGDEDEDAKRTLCDTKHWAEKQNLEK